MGGGCQWPCRPLEEEARPGAGQRPPGACGVVPSRQAHQGRRMVGRPGLGGTLRGTQALVVHQPPGRRRLLGVADTAVVGLALGGHRGRPAHPCAGAHEHLRARHAVAAGISAASVPGARRPARRAAGLRLLQAFFLRLQAGLLSAALGAGRRGWALSRPLLFTRQRLHRAGQHLHHRARGARPCRPAAGSARATVRTDLSLLLRQHAGFVRRPVPAVRRPRGAAGQDRLGLHALLEPAGAAVLSRPCHRPEGAVAPAQRTRHLPAPEPGGAGVFARLGHAQPEAQPAGDAGPGSDAVAGAAQRQPVRHLGR